MDEQNKWYELRTRNNIRTQQRVKTWAPKGYLPVVNFLVNQQSFQIITTTTNNT